MTIYVGTKPLNEILEPRTTSKMADTGIVENGKDITERYEKVGNNIPAGNIGLLDSNGNDLGPLFAAYGGVTYWDGSVSAATDVGDTRQAGSGITAWAEITFSTYGNIITRSSTAPSGTTHGQWTGSSADTSNTEIRFTVVSGSGGSLSNNASDWEPISVNRRVRLSLSDNGYGRSVSRSVRIELRKTGDSSTVQTTQVTLSVQQMGIIQ